MSASKVCAVFGFGPGTGAAAARKWGSEGFKVNNNKKSLSCELLIRMQHLDMYSTKDDFFIRVPGGVVVEDA
jgi:hypothetical protein